MLIAEIILTVFAWRNGWRWYSLIPMGAALVIGMIIGICIAISGNVETGVVYFTVPFDIMAIVALIVMCCKKRKTETKIQLND